MIAANKIALKDGALIDASGQGGHPRTYDEAQAHCGGWDSNPQHVSEALFDSVLVLAAVSLLFHLCLDVLNTSRQLRSVPIVCFATIAR